MICLPPLGRDLLALVRKRPLTNTDGNSNYIEAANVFKIQHKYKYFLNYFFTKINITVKKEKSRSCDLASLNNSVH